MYTYSYRKKEIDKFKDNNMYVYATMGTENTNNQTLFSYIH